MKSFATHGFANTSLRAVASTAGVSLGLVQHHFATKAGLIKAVDDYVLAVVLTRITQPVPDLDVGFGRGDRRQGDPDDRRASRTSSTMSGAH